MYKEIAAKAENMQEKLIMRRRDFHKYAETGWFEMRTSSLIARELKNLGYEVLTGTDVCEAQSRMGMPSAERLNDEYERAIQQGADEEFVKKTHGGFTGVIGILDCGEGPTVAMRFDIDALSLPENCTEEHKPFKEDFASVNAGMMHACGHDGHASIGLGVAEVLSEIKDSLCGKIKLIFQPAEEGVRGAKSIVENGHLDNVDYVIGAHLGEYKEDRTVEIGVGNNNTLATTKFDVFFHGTPAHAAVAPHLGNNAMLAMATAILNLQAIPRHGDAPTRVNVGRAEGGDGRNIICDYGKLEIEVRGNTSQANRFMEEYAYRIIDGAAKMHGCTYNINMMGSAPSMCNSEELKGKIARVCEQDMRLKVQSLEGETSASEDFSYMAEKVQQSGGQACYFMLMTICEGTFHNDMFDFDEAALVKGVKAFCGTVYDILYATK